MTRASPTPPASGLVRHLHYGLLGAPLAFAALPLYVQWPAHAAGHWGLPLAGLGLLLLAVRLADALIDPWVGRWADASFARAPARAWGLAGGATALMVAGIAALFLAPVPAAGATAAVWAWAGLLLAVTSWSYSVALVVHQAWAARLGGDASAQARWVGAREGFALTGVVVASVLPAWAGWPGTVALLAALALVAWLALGRVLPPALPAHAPARDGAASAGAGPNPNPNPNRNPNGGPDTPLGRPSDPVGPGAAARASPWRDRHFRALLSVYALNALASAVPAVLVLFFVRDVLQADDRTAGGLLGLYFVCAAAAVPAWVRAVDRFGLRTAWSAGMLLAIAGFAGAGLLGAGDVLAFAAVCAASGLALGADLVVAPSWLAQLHQRHHQRHHQQQPPQHSPQQPAQRPQQPAPAPLRAQPPSQPQPLPPAPSDQGLWFGWWALAGKLMLALAAGLALPLAQALGYRPGASHPGATAALAAAYAWLPCLIKAAALAALYLQRQLLDGAPPAVPPIPTLQESP